MEPHCNDSDCIRFFSQVILEETEGHWLWVASLHTKGYGHFDTYEVGRKRQWLSHRWLAVHLRPDLPWELGMNFPLDHVCEISNCVRFEYGHVEVRTPEQNIIAGKQVTHCPYGHRLEGDNLLIVRPTGRNPVRRCRQCSRDAQTPPERQRKPRVPVEPVENRRAFGPGNHPGGA